MYSSWACYQGLYWIKLESLSLILRIFLAVLQVLSQPKYVYLPSLVHYIVFLSFAFSLLVVIFSSTYKKDDGMMPMWRAYETCTSFPLGYCLDTRSMITWDSHSS